MRITASVFDNTQEAIMITDVNNAIVNVNSAFTRITGYSREEVIGKNPKLLGSSQHGEEYFVRMWASLQKTKNWRGEIWNQRKSGEVYAGMLSISSICNVGGEVQRYVAVFSDISYLKKHEAELKRIAHYDALTSIPNRALLADRMKHSIAQTSREQNMMAVCYLDLDGFKPINDTMGHDAGDQILIEVAKRLGDTIRGGDTVARLGGDEFVILLLGLEKGEECVTTLERLLAAISQPITVKKKLHTISASIGVSIYPLDNEDPDTLLRHADQAMYVAKQSGKNRFYIYDPVLDMRARDHEDFLKTIRHGLERNQFELYYQPKVDLRTKELVGAEALIRWRHPDRGLLFPAEFLRHIENTDLDIEIGEWVTATAIAQINRWQQAGLDVEVSINISAYHLESKNFAKMLLQQLALYPDMPHGKLQIEVLETAALSNVAIVGEIIEACQKTGVLFALDDFGTGYCSLTYLSNLPVNVLKIDQSFVRDMLEDKGDMAIVQGIIALARAFDRQTVAEGIETEDHYQVLLDMGCELGQGYYIAKPMTADELINWRWGTGNLSPQPDKMYVKLGDGSQRVR
jgi:diguanylate cyclase (GGDEF)-like protein/PAS domain S-box-containing protein